MFAEYGCEYAVLCAGCEQINGHCLAAYGFSLSFSGISVREGSDLQASEKQSDRLVE